MLRMLIAALTLAVLSTACAASPTLTVTRELTAAEIAAQAEADRNFSATPAYLARVKNRAASVDSVRFEMFTTIESSIISMGSRSEPIMTGEQSGTTSRIAMDMGELFGVAAGLSGIDADAMTMTMVTDGDITYLNTPMFAEIFGATGLSTDDYPWVVDIAIGWGHIDAGKSGSELISNMGVSGGAGVDEMLTLLDSVGDVLDGGTSEIRGSTVRIAHAEVSVAQVLEQSGQSLRDMGFGGAQAEMLDGLAANIAVYIDEEGRVLRLEYTMDLSALNDTDPQLANLNMRMWQRVDFFDHGKNIDIAVPVSSVDITNDFEDLLDELN